MDIIELVALNPEDKPMIDTDLYQWLSKNGNNDADQSANIKAYCVANNFKDSLPSDVQETFNIIHDHFYWVKLNGNKSEKPITKPKSKIDPQRGVLYRVKTKNNLNHDIEEVRLCLGPYSGLGLIMHKFIAIKTGDIVDYNSNQDDFTINGVYTKSLSHSIESPYTYEVISTESPDAYLAA